MPLGGGTNQDGDEQAKIEVSQTWDGKCQSDHEQARVNRSILKELNGHLSRWQGYCVPGTRNNRPRSLQINKWPIFPSEKIRSPEILVKRRSRPSYQPSESSQNRNPTHRHEPHRVQIEKTPKPRYDSNPEGFDRQMSQLNQLRVIHQLYPKQSLRF